jgi:hypothetical protein
MGGSGIKDVSSLLSAFFDGETAKAAARAAGFFGGWAQIVGERLAAHSRISEIERGIVIVEAEHPGWIQVLQLRQSDILESLRQRFPELGLRAIVFRLAAERHGSRPWRGYGEGRAVESPSPETAGRGQIEEPEAPDANRGAESSTAEAAALSPASEAEESDELKAALRDLKLAVFGKRAPPYIDEER